MKPWAKIIAIPLGIACILLLIALFSVPVGR